MLTNGAGLLLKGIMIAPVPMLGREFEKSFAQKASQTKKISKYSAPDISQAKSDFPNVSWTHLFSSKARSCIDANVGIYKSLR